MNIPPEVARQQGHHGKKGGRPSLPIPEEAKEKAWRDEWRRLKGGKELDPDKEKLRLAKRASYHRNKAKKPPKPPREPKERKSRGREPWEAWKARYDLVEKPVRRFEMARTRLMTADAWGEDKTEILKLEAEAAKAAGRSNFAEREAAEKERNTPEAKAARKARWEEWEALQKAERAAAKAANRAKQEAARAAKAAAGLPAKPPTPKKPAWEPSHLIRRSKEEQYEAEMEEREAEERHLAELKARLASMAQTSRSAAKAANRAKQEAERAAKAARSRP